MIFDNLEFKRNEGTLSFGLIDPDRKNDYRLDKIIDIANKSNFDALLVGGSEIEDNLFLDRVEKIKSRTSLPLILFPGDANQISPEADAILFTTLLNSRSPRYLIEEQLAGVETIDKFNLEVIPTSYLLFETDKTSAVEKVSKSVPISMNDRAKIKKYILASIYLGKKMIFLETGSNSNMTMDLDVIRFISDLSSVPIIVGGGIKDCNTARLISEAGASYIVIGSMLENASNHHELLDINQSIRNE